MSTDLNKEKLAMIKKYGHCDRLPQGRVPGEYSVICQKCGKKIKSDSDLSDIGFSVTKRQTAYFWHGKCKGSPWDNKIQWEAEK